MRKTENNTSFLDMLFILVVVFVGMLMLALPFLNPIADEGKIDPDGLAVVILRWDDNSVKDLDLWVRGPDGKVVSFQRKDSGSGVYLDRDDLGGANDQIIVDGEVKIIKRNTERVTITNLADGEWVINVHHFSSSAGEIVAIVDVIGLMPYRIWFSGDAILTSRREVTLVTFMVENGKVVDVRTDLQIPLRPRAGSANG